jgi:hypothetical protein
VLAPTDETNRRTIEVRVDRAFRPFALLVWGASPASLIRSLRASEEEQLTGAIPGHLFEPDLSFAEFARLLSPRHGMLSGLAPIGEIGHYMPLLLPTLSPLNSLGVTLDGPFGAVAFIGKMLVEERAAARG